MCGEDFKMSREERIWKLLALLATIAGIASSFYFHWDGKHSIVDALADRYEFVDKEMSYEQALEELDRDREEMKNDNDQLSAENKNLKTENRKLKNELDCFEKIKLAESYATTGNYKVAIPMLNGITEKPEEVIALLEDYRTKYENSIITDAKTLADSEHLNEATMLIEEALEVIPDSQLLNSMKSSFTPKYLVDTIECYKAENLWLLDKKEQMKISGKSYKHAIYSQSSDIAGNMLNMDYSANAFYNLDGKYSKISGVVGHIDFSGSGTIGMNDGGRVYDAEITILGDSEVLERITLLSDTPAKDFNISIDGVKILEFLVECKGNSKVGIAEIQIR